MPPSLAICVINFQGRDVLAENAGGGVSPGAARTGEVVLVDNASTDGSLDLARGPFPQVRVIRLAWTITAPARRARLGLRAVEHGPGRLRRQ